MPILRITGFERIETDYGRFKVPVFELNGFVKREDWPDLGEALPRLVARMVKSYLSDQRTQHIDRAHLPSRRVIVEICGLLLLSVQ